MVWAVPNASALLAKVPWLLLYPQNSVLCGLGNTKFDDGLGWNLDLLLRLWIKARARLPLLLYEFAKTGQDKFAVLFNLFVRDVAERIEKYSSGSFVGLGGFGKCTLEFGLGHFVAVGYVKSQIICERELVICEWKQWIQDYERAERLSVFLRKQRSDRGKSRRPSKVNDIIETAIKKIYRTAEQLDVAAVIEEVQFKCFNAKTLT